MFRALLRPPSKGLNRFRVSMKFGIVATLFFLSAVVPTLFMVRGQNLELAHLQKEHEGAAFLRPLYALTAHVAQHRLEFQNQQEGAEKATDNGPSLAHLEAAIENDLARLAEAEQRLDPAMRLRNQVPALREGWRAVMTAKEPGPHLAAHDRLLRAIQALNARAVDASELVLDRDLARFYLIELSTVQLPQQATSALDLCSRAQDVAEGKPLKGEERAVLHMGQGAVQTVVDAIQEGMDSTRGCSNPTVALRLGMRLQEHLQASRAFSKAVATGILGEKPSAPLAEIRFLGREAVLSCFKFQEASLKVLDDLLMERLGAVRFEQRFAFGAALLAALLAFYLLAALYANLTDGLADLAACLAGLKAGDLSRPAQVASRDELGDLAAAFNDSLAGLRDLVASLRATGTTVQEAAAAIAEGGADLARRTEAQAASLDRTTAAIEEIAVTAAQTEQSAKRANQGVQRMSGHMDSCLELVGIAARAMETMGAHLAGLSKAVREVEELAFQAKVLAMDALAPSDGPAKQLHLLATQAHALGRRGAEVSEDLKALLEEHTAGHRSSHEHLARAQASVQGMGHGLQEVAAFLQEAATAAEVQAQQMNEISQAMTQLDALTQDDTVLVERAAISAGTLAEQARDLGRRMASFRL